MFVDELCLVEMQPTDFFQENNGSGGEENDQSREKQCKFRFFCLFLWGGGWKVHEEFGRMDLFLLLPTGVGLFRFQLLVFV